MQLSRLVAAIFMAFILLCAGPGAQARLLRGGPSGAGRALLKDAKDAGAAVDSWGGRDWPATRQVAFTSQRGSVAPASSRSYAYSTGAAPIMMSGAMNAPIMDGWSSGMRG